MYKEEIPQREEIEGQVLVVDDEEKNREMLRDILVSEGHDVREARDGEETLAIVTDYKPDLILLDIMMPGMDGYEVCKRIRRDEELLHIPIIMVTALNEKEDKLKGIEVGANDFLSKPISSRNVILRARNAIYSHKLYSRILESYNELDELQEIRDNLMHMIVHDMNSPLTVIKGNVNIANTLVDSEGNKKLTDVLNNIEVSVNRLIKMVHSILDVNKFESNSMELKKREVDLVPILEESIDSMSALKKNRELVLSKEVEVNKRKCDPDIIRRVIDNLITNAIEFTPSDGKIEVAIAEENRQTKISVKDNGPGIPEEDQDKIFKKFGQAKTRAKNKKYSVGLGLTFCKLAIEAHEGEIGVNSEPGEGSEFWFRI